MPQRTFNLITYIEAYEVDDDGSERWNETGFYTMTDCHAEPEQIMKSLRTFGLSQDELAQAEASMVYPEAEDE